MTTRASAKAQYNWATLTGWGGKLRLYARLHSGYGANLLEYNHKNHAFGVGLMFNDWIGF